MEVFEMMKCNCTNDYWMLEHASQVVACIQKWYSILLGGVMQMIESTWLNDVQRGGACQFSV
jgi:hypothetical protein